jgi:hypothetical protein
VHGDCVTPREVRRRALPRAAAWLGGASAVTLVLYWAYPRATVVVDLAGAGLPGAMALANLLELATGVPMSAWEARWASLSGAAKLGVSVAVVASVLLFFAVVVVTLIATGVIR